MQQPNKIKNEYASTKRIAKEVKTVMEYIKKEIINSSKQEEKEKKRQEKEKKRQEKEISQFVNGIIKNAIKQATKSSPKIRKNVENNAYELIVALCFIEPTIATKEDCISISYEKCESKLKGCTKESFEKYKKDMVHRSPRVIESYIHQLRRGIVENSLFQRPIVSVYLEGKTQTSSEIIHLNQNINTKYAKADVYVEYDEKEFIGISCKQDKKCTKTNYSVEKIINECVKSSNEDNHHSVMLPEVRKKVLKDAGYEKHLKSERKSVNELFYPNHKNDYWDELRNQIKTFNNEIKTRLIGYLYPDLNNLCYPLYEFDGVHLKQLKLDKTTIYFQEHEPYYHTKKNELREAAKLFYQLKVQDQIYRVEVRWKGTIHTASPQFQIHLDVDDSP